uniref:Uncharacterized protein n=1 Tax=Tetranychus urticae TaxID=32264 RepID=T1JRS3_TETUR
MGFSASLKFFIAGPYYDPYFDQFIKELPKSNRTKLKATTENKMDYILTLLCIIPVIGVKIRLNDDAFDSIETRFCFIKSFLLKFNRYHHQQHHHITMFSTGNSI